MTKAYDCTALHLNCPRCLITRERRKEENHSLILMMPVQSGTWSTWSIMAPMSALDGWLSVGYHFFVIVLG